MRGILIIKGTVIVTKQSRGDVIEICLPYGRKKCNYPLILHPLLIISELARNYPLIIRQLSYTISEIAADYRT